MKRVLHRIYSTYSLAMFGLGLVLLFPFFLLLILIAPLRRYLWFLNRLWAIFFLGLSGVPWRIRYEAPLDTRRQYVICANHFSILDIVTMSFLPLHFIYVGKSSLGKIPLFGYMYRKLHITVDRSSRKDSYRALQASMAAVEKGNSLVMFPEGGVVTDCPPQMARFKDGPFRVAIEKQIPVLPVSIPYNWLILPDDDRFLLYPRRVEMLIHAPVPTVGLTLEDLPALREQVYQTIARELSLRNQQYLTPRVRLAEQPPGSAGA